MLLLIRIAWTILVPALVAAAMPGVADAQLTKAGVVTTLQGTATVARASAPQPMPLRFKDEVFVQDRITTGNDSVARILLGGKAIVTVRERSVLTITEVPGTSTIDLGIGKIALAVVKERMKSGEVIEIRTPNAVAGIRGTVVITEVDQTTAQLTPARGAFTSRFTVLQGVVAVSQYNPVTRQLGPSVNLGALQTTGITGSAAPRPPVTITPEAAKQLASEYKTTIKEAPAAANAALANAQVQQAVSHVGSVLGPRQEPQGGEGTAAKGEGDVKAREAKSDAKSGDSKSTEARSGDTRSGGAEPSSGGAQSSTSASGTGGRVSLGGGGAPAGEKNVGASSGGGPAVSAVSGSGQTSGGGGSAGGGSAVGGSSGGGTKSSTGGTSGGPKTSGRGSSGGAPKGVSGGGGAPKLGGGGSIGGGAKIGGGAAGGNPVLSRGPGSGPGLKGDDIKKQPSKSSKSNKK